MKRDERGGGMEMRMRQEGKEREEERKREASEQNNFAQRVFTDFESLGVLGPHKSRD